MRILHSAPTSEAPEPRLSQSRPDAPPPLPLPIDYVPQASLHPTSTSLPSILTLRLSREHLTTSSHAFRQRQLWGTDVYTSDSDLPCVLQHSGRFVLHPTPPPTSRLDSLLVRLRLVRYAQGMPPFEASQRHGIRSRRWGIVYSGICMSIVQVAAVKDGVETVLANPVAALLRPYVPNLVWAGVHESAPMSVDVPVMFDSLNEPCLCYSIAAVAGGGVDERLWPRRRLASEVMYLENATDRFELAAINPVGEGSEKRGKKRLADNSVKPFDLRLRLAKIRKGAVAKLRLQSNVHTLRHSKGDKTGNLPTPLHSDSLEVVRNDLSWSDLLWTADGLSIKSDGGKYLDSVKVTKLAFKAVKR